MSRAEKAKEYFTSGYACSQAIALAFHDLCGVDESLAAKMSLPFGGGLGRLRLTCGAVSGMALVYGLIFSADKLDSENKKQAYEDIRYLTGKFTEKNGSIICADLLAGKNLVAVVGGEAEARTEGYYKKRPCGDLVYSAAEILEEFLKERGVI